MLSTTKRRRPEDGGKPGSRGARALGRLLLPTVILLPPVVLSTFWYRPTHVRLELETTRLSLNLGDKGGEILNPAVPFSSLVIEHCSLASFTAESLAAVDPRQPVPKAGLVKLPCRDPEAKLTLRHPDPAAAQAGTLDRVPLDPHSQVSLEVSPAREPAVSLEIETPQSLRLAVGPDLELVADFVAPEGLAVPPSPGFPLTWRARIPAAHPFFEVASGERGLVLTVTPARGHAAGAADVFLDKPDLPLASLELLEEHLRGEPGSALHGPVRLSYPDYLNIPPVTIEQDERLGLGALSQARLTHLSFDAAKGVLRVGFDGTAERPASAAGERVRDHRLTLFHTVYHNWRWAVFATAGAWLVATSWAVFEIWKKLQE